MKSFTTKRFRAAFVMLPKEIQQKARECYKQFLENPHHSTLHFKQVHPSKPLYSVRITIGYRAVGLLDHDEILWFWLGPHDDYDKLISHF